MKKLALIIAVAGIVGLSSCAKSGTECTISTIGIKTTVTVEDGSAETCVLTACSTSTFSGTDEDYVKSLEAAGYSCD